MVAISGRSSPASSVSATARAVAWLAVLAPSLHLAAEATPTGTCYFPDGSVSPADSPCTNDTVTHCCNSLNACLSNGYCMSLEQTPYVISRGSCTDDEWGDECPQRCKAGKFFGLFWAVFWPRSRGYGLKVQPALDTRCQSSLALSLFSAPFLWLTALDNPGGGYPIAWLGRKDANGSQQYCCGAVAIVGDSTNCSSSTDGPFTLPKASLIYDAGILAGITNTTSNATCTDTSGASTSSSAPADNDSDNDNNTSTNSGPSATAVGAGVGVSLGVVALTAVSWALWERRKRTLLMKALALQNQEMTMGYAGGGGPPGPAGGQAAAGYSGSQQQQQQQQYVPVGGGSSPDSAAFKTGERNPLVELAAESQHELPEHGSRP